MFNVTWIDQCFDTALWSIVILFVYSIAYYVHVSIYFFRLLFLVAAAFFWGAAGLSHFADFGVFFLAIVFLEPASFFLLFDGTLASRDFLSSRFRFCAKPELYDFISSSERTLP